MRHPCSAMGAFWLPLGTERCHVAVVSPKIPSSAADGEHGATFWLVVLDSRALPRGVLWRAWS